MLYSDYEIEVMSKGHRELIERDYKGFNKKYKHNKPSKLKKALSLFFIVKVQSS